MSYVANRQHAICITLVFLLITIGAARIISTYTVFNATADEPLHIAAGMRWLEQLEYMYDHPPLARVAAALPLYIAGLRSAKKAVVLFDWQSLVREGNGVLYNQGRYTRNLTIARLAILPFFLIACLVVWFWSEKLFGTLSGVIALLLFTTLPSVLAHGGIVTTDMAATATLAYALYALCLWLKSPTFFRSFLLGVSLACGILVKFSFIVFFPVCAVVTVTLFGLQQARSARAAVSRRPSKYWTPICYVCGIAFFLVWAGYRFSLSPLTTARTRPHANTDEIFGKAGLMHDLAYSVVETPVPAADLLMGLLYTWNHNAEGHQSYLLGQVRNTGWWYFFPVALGVKTPIPFLILCGIGIFFLIRLTSIPTTWQHWVLALCPATIMLVCMTSKINIGVRHILPIFPMLSIVAGYGAARLIETGRRSKTAFSIALILLLWQFTSSALAHPDYLAYFNEIAELSGRKPEQILIDSDLDWGQDLNRLRDTLRRLKVDSVSIGYFGTADLNQHGLPNWKPLVPNVPTTGWIAISVYRFKLPVTVPGSGRVFNGFSWLERWQPVATVGKSIKLYYISADGKQSQDITIKSG